MSVAIRAAVLEHGGEFFLVTGTSPLPESMEPFTYRGRFRWCDGQLQVTPNRNTENRDGDLLILGAALGAFASYVERVLGGSGSVDALERMYQLPDLRVEP
jgi:hypothetical protein